MWGYGDVVPRGGFYAVKRILNLGIYFTSLSQLFYFYWHYYCVYTHTWYVYVFTWVGALMWVPVWACIERPQVIYHYLQIWSSLILLSWLALSLDTDLFLKVLRLHNQSLAFFFLVLLLVLLLSIVVGCNKKTPARHGLLDLGMCSL